VLDTRGGVNSASSTSAAVLSDLRSRPCWCQKNTVRSGALAIFTGSVAGNRSTLIPLAKFEVLFNRQEPGSWAAGWEPKWEPTCTAIRRRQATSSHHFPS